MPNPPPAKAAHPHHWWSTWEPTRDHERLLSVQRIDARDGWLLITDCSVYWAVLAHDGLPSIRLLYEIPHA